METETDFLGVDKPIPGQNFACLSFLSPQKTLEDKNNFFFYNFIKDQLSINIEYDKFKNDYLSYLEDNNEKLTKIFDESNNFQTSTMGIKVRGVYNTQQEAAIRAKVLQKVDPSFNVFVGQIGYWLPWDPNPDQISDQEYHNDQLNKLAKKYKENEELRDNFYESDKKEKIEKSLDKDNMVDSLVDQIDSSLDHADLKKEFNEYSSISA